MNNKPIKIKRALISLSNKEGIVEFARSLHKSGVEIISTGGTAKKLQDANIPVISVSSVTGFPEIMDGRVKTLHPKIHGGILGLRDSHNAEAGTHDIKWIDLVVCNLYPFANTIQKPEVTLDTAIENIDIGGPSMLRSAAKNFSWVGVVVDHKDYAKILEQLHSQKGLDFETRKELAAKAFAHTAQYDALIADYLNYTEYSENLTLTFKKTSTLRYGENPHQSACAYQQIMANPSTPITKAKQHQGKQLSYNNIIDAEGGIACIKEFTATPACVVIKHTTPCGVAEDNDINSAFTKAWQADSKSAFGGIVVLNRPCTKNIAEKLAKVFIEIIIAPAYENEALKTFAAKPNLRVLEADTLNTASQKHRLKHIHGGLLVQSYDNNSLTETNLTLATETKPTQTEINDLLFGWKVAKHSKSNAIVLAKNRTTLGIGPGQVSRIDAVEIAIRKSSNKLEGAILASDAFFPFRDAIDRIATTGIKAIIQPGGSIRDQEVIDACNEYGIAMVFTGIRCFNH